MMSYLDDWAVTTLLLSFSLSPIRCTLKHSITFYEYVYKCVFAFVLVHAEAGGCV